MITFSPSFKQWLMKYHPEKITPLMFGHLECFTPEMRKSYLEWCTTTEGKQYLAGGSKYKENKS